MSKISASHILAAGLLLASSALSPLYAQSSAPPNAPDSGLYTTYYLSGGNQTVYWTVCGSTQESAGCYQFGSMGPFAMAGAILEGLPSVAGNVVIRNIYIVDSGDTSGVKLYIYKKTDTVTSSSDTTTVILANTISLPLTGGINAHDFMAANDGFLFIGTDQSSQAVEVNKTSLAVTKVGGFYPPINVSSITANEYGYFTITQGNGTDTGFYVIGPNGYNEGDGGGSNFVVGTTQAVTPTAAQANTAQFVPRMGYRLKSSAQSLVK